MRGTKAKLFRKTARVLSKPTEQKTTWYKKLIKGKSGDDGKPVYDIRGTVTNTGYRDEYQKLKKMYKAEKRQTK